MKRLHRIVALTAAIGLGTLAGAANAQITLTGISGGSQNMVDYVTDYLGPLFEKQNPGVKVSVVGTGPDDAGSQKMLASLLAQKNAGVAVWDTDVIIPNQQKTGEMVREGLLMKYRDSIPTGKYAVSQSAKQALGANAIRANLGGIHHDTGVHQRGLFLPLALNSSLTSTGMPPSKTFLSS